MCQKVPKLDFSPVFLVIQSLIRGLVQGVLVLDTLCFKTKHLRRLVRDLVQGVRITRNTGLKSIFYSGITNIHTFLLVKIGTQWCFLGCNKDNNHGYNFITKKKICWVHQKKEVSKQHQFSKIIISFFLRVCWFLGKHLYNFVSPAWNLDTRIAIIHSRIF
jgi:hypothetical protein